MRFCGSCGAALTKTDEQSAPTRHHRNLAAASSERRQITVMFCDLIDSTRLSGMLDPEDFSRAVIAYREAAVGAIERFGGTVARFLGDGLLVYFGYPMAQEDDPFRAVRAGLAVLATMSDLNDRLAAEKLPAVHVRIGIHTGIAMVGDLGTGTHREASAVLGETPNIAARLQSLASPDQLVISEDTNRIVAGRFGVADCGQQSLAGVARPIQVFAVHSELPRHERTVTRHATPMVDREREIEALLDAWQLARERRGGAVVVEGEAGIGKSRLVAEFHRRLPRRTSVAAIACRTDERASAFQPVIEWLLAYLRLAPAADAETRRRQLHSALLRRKLPPVEFAPPIANLLGIATEEQQARLPVAPRRRRRRMIDALIHVMLALGAQSPLLVIVEDCHWADESTMDFVRALVERSEGGWPLLVLTTRGGHPPPVPVAQRIVLERLSAQSSRILARMVAGEIAEPILDQIVVRTDGVPLFLEEVAFTARDRSSSVAAGSAGDIPMTLRDSLMAQLDRLQEAKPVAQFAAVLGRSFQTGVIRAVLATPPDDDGDAVDTALQRLEQAHFLERDVERDTYRFRHALIQEVAYESLPRNRRQQYHLQIAAALQQFPGMPETRPELLGHHLAAAGRIGEAVDSHASAAARASRLSATVEALHHYETALRLLAQLPDTRERGEREITLQISLAAQLIVARGNATSGVEAAAMRARELSERLGNERMLIRSLRTLLTFHLVRGNIDEAHDICLEFVRRVPGINDPDFSLQAYRPYGLCLLYLGRFAEARQVLHRALEFYDPVRHGSHRFEYGSDPAVLAHAHLGWVEWYLGNEAAAEAQCRTAVAEARALDHPHSLCFALGFQACLEQFRDNPALVQTIAEEIGQVAHGLDYAYWVAWSEILLGWAIARSGETERGEQVLRGGLSDYTATGAGLLRPYASSLIAEILPAARRAEALQLLNAAIEEARARSILFCYARMLAQRNALVSPIEPAAGQ